MKILILSIVITFAAVLGIGCHSMRHKEVEYKINDGRMTEQSAKTILLRVLSQASYGPTPIKIQFVPEGVVLLFPDGVRLNSSLGAFYYFAKSQTDVTRTQNLYILRFDMVDKIRITHYTPRDLFYCTFIRGEADYYQFWTFSMQDAQDMADAFLFLQKINKSSKNSDLSK